MNPPTPFSAQSVIFTTTSGEGQRELMVKFLEKQVPTLVGRLNNAPDVLWIEDEKALGIEQIRYLKEWLQEKPYSQPWKVAVLLRADTLTPEAQNAALKILEEPPSYAHIVLVTAKPFALQGTIRSRCSVQTGNSGGTQETKPHTFPQTATEAFALVDTLAKERADATQWCEHALLHYHHQLEAEPNAPTVFKLQLLRYALRNLKRNVSVRLAMENIFLRSIYRIV